MKLAMIFALTLLVCSAGYAQSGLVGKYSGSLLAPGTVSSNRERTFPILIEINAADSGKLKGSITSYNDPTCGRNSREAEGSYEGNGVKFAQTEKARIPGCDPLTFEGVAEGNKFVGKVFLNGVLRDITLSK